MTPPEGKLIELTEGSRSRKKDFALVAMLGTVLVGCTILLTFNLIDQSEKHVREVKNTHTSGPDNSLRPPEENEADLAVKKQIASNPDATILNFEHHVLTDKAMPSIKTCGQLTNLSLAYSNVTDKGLEYLRDLPLTALNLSDTGVTDDGAKTLGEIGTIRYLNLSETDISDKAIIALRPLKDLNDLHLAGTKITDKSLEELVKHHQPIWKLVLINTAVSDQGMRTISRLENLTTLSIDGTSVTSRGLSAFKNHKTFGKLSMQNCNLGDKEIESIANDLPQLVWLELSRNHLTDECLNALSRLESLKTVLLNHNDISDEGIEKLRRKLPGCDVVKIF